MKLVIFDLDGTLIDSRTAIAVSLNAALTERGFAEVSHARGIALIGLPLVQMFPVLVDAPLDEAENQALCNAYRAAYGAQAQVHERVYDGIPGLLQALVRAGRTLAVATSKSTSGARRAARRHGLDRHLGTLLGVDAVANPKPAPDMVLRLMTDSGVGPEGTVVVGDTRFDMQMGRAAGVATIGVTWGAHPRAELAPVADHVADDMATLASLLGVA